jgi:predicted RNA polymerase sigma factor
MKKKRNPKSRKLAASWLTATHTNQWEDYEAFARELYQECCRQAPPGRFNGVLAGLENEVRQEACLILLNRFLADNPHLNRETRPQAVGRHLIKSVKICVRYAVGRIARQKSRRCEIAAQESQFGSVNHPRCRTFADLSFEEKRALALATLELAVEEKLLSAQNEAVFRLQLMGGHSQREIAKKLGVSPSAIHQRLQRVVAQLSILKNAVEEEIQ